MAMSMSLKIEQHIEAVLKQQVALIKEAMIQTAVKESEEEVREAVGRVAVNVADYYSVERMGSVLQVRIETGETNGR
jgi:hypothetical protein